MIKEIGAGLGLGIIAGLFVLGFNMYPLLLLVGLFFLLTRVVDARGSLKQFVPVNNTGTNTRISFDDIGGQNSAKRELLEALEFLKVPEKMYLLGIRPLKEFFCQVLPGPERHFSPRPRHTILIRFLSAAGSEFIEMYRGWCTKNTAAV